jgi:peptide-methionine (S)-S-oxide reductase
MRHRLTRVGGAIVMFTLFATLACDRPVRAAGDLPIPASDVPASADQPEATAVLAGGCFWCVEGIFERLDGVSAVVSGYAGGTKETATYEQVSSGRTDHAEAVQITYDPKRISYGRILQVFFATHDPTTKDRQGPDWGRQYRSAVFVADEAQKQVAEAYIRQLTEAKVFGGPIVTTLEPLTEFFPAETYHQDYVAAHPDNPYVRQWFPAKLEKLKKQFADQLKEGAK